MWTNWWQSLEYEKALPRKGKVFQMKWLSQSNGLQKNEKWSRFWQECDQTSCKTHKRAHFEWKHVQMSRQEAKWSRSRQKCGRMKRQSLEYEKASPRKGEVFQMKWLPQPSGGCEPAECEYLRINSEELPRAASQLLAILLTGDYFCKTHR